jgi:hypothetical protein
LRHQSELKHQIGVCGGGAFEAAVAFGLPQQELSTQAWTGPFTVDEEDTFCTALYLGGYSKRKWRKATSSNDYVVQTGISSSVRHSPATFPAGEGQL